MDLNPHISSPDIQAQYLVLIVFILSLTIHCYIFHSFQGYDRRPDDRNGPYTDRVRPLNLH
jgi:hypothetical protein